VLHVGADGIAVATGSGTLVLTELQRAGGKRLGVADFLRGFAVVPGQCFDPPGGSATRPLPSLQP